MKKILVLTMALLLIMATAVMAEEWNFLGTYKITGYDICYRCCGKVDGITASGVKAIVGRTIAAPSNFPFGTVLFIEGIGYRTVEDRGGSIKGKRLDVLCSNHNECYAITKNRKVWVITWTN